MSTRARNIIKLEKETGGKADRKTNSRINRGRKKKEQN
jgi:hypothetical protein